MLGFKQPTQSHIHISEQVRQTTISPPECVGQDCGEPCGQGICNGEGICVSPEENPCVVHGCKGKNCGDSCIQGDIAGVCDSNENCEFDVNSVICGTSIFISQNFMKFYILKNLFFI